MKMKMLPTANLPSQGRQTLGWFSQRSQSLARRAAGELRSQTLARLATGVILTMLAAGWAGRLAAEEADGDKPTFEPTCHYEPIDVEGWQVLVNRRLADPHSDVGQRALRLLRLQLYQVATLVPDPQLARLRQVKIWLDDDPQNRIHYHPHRQWLVDNGYNPDRAKAVDIGRADRFLNVYRDQPYVVLHELAHAYHDQVLGFDDPRVEAAFERAVEEGKYQSVLKISGRSGRHYALSNPKEYFAEATESFLGTNDFYPFVRAELQEHDPRLHRLLDEIWLAQVTPPPPDVVRKFKLDEFYKKHVSAAGLPVISSENVADAALLEAAYLINRMLDERHDIRQALIKNRTRFVVMGAGEFTTDIPEHSDLTPKDYWDRRARGLGATPVRPAVSCGEENLLGCPGDPYRLENILVHEFAHAIHHMALNTLDPEFDRRLQSIYDRALNEELWEGKYAANNRAEYWAEGVQSYFGTNRPPDHDHNHVDTRDELEEYDPRLFGLIDEVFRGNRWQYVRAAERAGRAHLAGLDRDRLASFRWPERLAAETAKLEALKKEKLKAAAAAAAEAATDP